MRIVVTRMHGSVLTWEEPESPAPYRVSHQEVGGEVKILWKHYEQLNGALKKWVEKLYKPHSS